MLHVMVFFVKNKEKCMAIHNGDNTFLQVYNCNTSRIIIRYVMYIEISNICKSTDKVDSDTTFSKTNFDCHDRP